MAAKKGNGRPGGKAPAGPSHEEIATLARQIWKVRGKISGFDLDDWLAAERHLKAVAASTGRPTGVRRRKTSS